MKQSKVNQKGSIIRHIVTHAPQSSAPQQTFAARATMEVRNNKVVFKWRIFSPQAKRAKE